MADHFEEFPFEEIRRPDGDYFSSWQEAKDAGYDDDQIWSVVESEGTFTYGPPHHFVNHIGHVVTQERHDGETYYHEEPDLSDLLDNADAEWDTTQSCTTAGAYLAALMQAESEDAITDDQFRDGLAKIRDWLLEHGEEDNDDGADS